MERGTASDCSLALLQRRAALHRTERRAKTHRFGGRTVHLCFVCVSVCVCVCVSLCVCVVRQVWVVCSESHYSVFFAPGGMPGAGDDWEAFDLYVVFAPQTDRCKPHAAPRPFQTNPTAWMAYELQLIPEPELEPGDCLPRTGRADSNAARRQHALSSPDATRAAARTNDRSLGLASCPAILRWWPATMQRPPMIRAAVESSLVAGTTTTSWRRRMR